ncbi:MAG: hypothetical protein HFI68_05290 [Lachnospiraceae bacterium]|nr:hypothetical protein [Lachnospiraceae bacterium]
MENILEEYALQEEQKVLWTYQNNDVEKWLKLIDTILASGEESQKEELLQIFHQKVFMDMCRNFDSLAHMCIIMDIYEQEKGAGEPVTILDLGRSSSELTALFCHIKFLLWRIEFVKDRQAQEGLLNYIEETGASPSMIALIAKRVSYRKMELLPWLAKIFMEARKTAYVERIREYLDRQVLENLKENRV